MNTQTLAPSLLAVTLIMVAGSAFAHCEIPCGIYDDRARYTSLEEHIATMEKAMDQITTLSAEGDKNYNQLVRWVTNKEEHAEMFQEIVTQYFLFQRIKPKLPSDGEDYDKYIQHLTLFHHMLVEAMKCKQTTDKAHIEKLRQLVGKSRDLYFE